MKDEQLVMADTSVLIAAFLGEEPWKSRMEKWTDQGCLRMSSIVLAEFLVKSSSNDESLINDLLQVVPLLSVDEIVARQAAKIRRGFSGRKKRLLLLDCLITAQCIVAGAKLATANASDYPATILMQ
jgi:predicted nucleic acid-binding protein